MCGLPTTFPRNRSSKMTEYASLGGDTGWTPGDVAVWNETQTNLALLGDLGQFNQDYGVWNLSGAAGGPAPGGGPAPSGKGPKHVILPPRERDTKENQYQEILAITMLLAVYSDSE